MPTTDEQKAKNKINNDKAKAKRIAKAEAEAEQSRAGSVLSNAVKRTLTTRKVKAGSVLSSAIKRSVIRGAFLKEKAPIRSSVASALSTKIAGAKSKSPSKEAGMSPPKVSPTKTSPTQTYEFDRCGVFYKDLTISKDEYMNCNFIPVNDELYNVVGKEKQDLLVRLFNQAKGYNKGKFVYRWCSEYQLNSNDADCIRYYEAMQEGIARRQGYDVNWKEGVRQKFKVKPIADGYEPYLIIINYGKRDKEILLYAQQPLKATLREKKGDASPPKNTTLKGYGEREIFYATEYHRDKAFNYNNNKVKS
jgi:hypothetical protein